MLGAVSEGSLTMSLRNTTHKTPPTRGKPAFKPSSQFTIADDRFWAENTAFLRSIHRPSTAQERPNKGRILSAMQHFRGVPMTHDWQAATPELTFPEESAQVGP